MISQIKETDYKRYLNMSYVISNKKEGRDLLHNLLIKLNDWGTPVNKVTDSYIFISLRNLYRRERRQDKFVDNEFELEKLKDIPEEEINYEEIENNKNEKLYFIRKEILNLRSSDIKLFELHFITWNDKRQRFGYSQRSIAKEIGVSHQLINQKVRIIVDHLNIKWNEFKKNK